MATKSVKKSIKEAARMGKGRDNTVAHLASGEVVIPLDFQKKFPAAGAALRQAFKDAGLDYDQFVVGSPKNRINPRTGAPMFDDGGGGGDGGGGDGGGGDGGGGDGGGGDGGGGDAGGGDAGGGDAGGGDAGGGDAGGGYGGDEGGGYGGGYGDASSGEGAGADEGGGGFGGFGGGFGDSGDASAGSTGDQGGGPSGGDPSGDDMGGDPDPDIPAGDPMGGSLPGQSTFNDMMDGLLGSALSGTVVGDLTSEDVRGGFQGYSAPSQDRADELAREDAIYALREDVARNEEVANTIMASQAAQEAASAIAAAANSNVTSGGLLSGESILDNSLGLTAANPGMSDIFGGPVYSSGPTTNEDTTSFPASDIAGTTGNMGMGSTQGQAGQESDVGAVTNGSGLSELGVTEVAPAPSIFDLSATGNLPVGTPEDGSDYVSGDGGDIIRPLTEEQRMIAEQLAAEEELRQQQATVRPTVVPIQYDISKFISGIGSLATSKQA